METILDAWKKRLGQIFVVSDERHGHLDSTSPDRADRAGGQVFPRACPRPEAQLSRAKGKT